MKKRPAAYSPEIVRVAEASTVTAGDVQGLSEAIDDRVNTLIVAGTNVTKSYNDAAGTLTLSATGGGSGEPGGGETVTVTLDPENTNNGLTLSNGDLTVARTGASTGVRRYSVSTHTVSAGKAGFKATIDSLAANIGIGVSNTPLPGYIGDASSAGAYTDGFLGYTGSLDTIGSFGAGPVWVIVNKTLAKAWMSFDSGATWKGPGGATGNPVAGTGGFSVPSGGLYAIVDFEGSGSTLKQVTFDFEDATGFPTGFNAWSTAAAVAEEPTSKVNPKTDFGAFFDDGNHPLSAHFATLAEAEEFFPGVPLVDLTHQYDWAACQAALNLCVGSPGAENASSSSRNKWLELPSGIANFSNDTLRIRNTMGFRMTGTSRQATFLKGNRVVFEADGLWYYHISNISFIKTAPWEDAPIVDAAVILDGNQPGHPYSTRGLQAGSIEDCLFDGGGGFAALAVCPGGQGGGQGSEQRFANNHYQNAHCCYYSIGANALSNSFIGGNFQNFVIGAALFGSTASFYNCGFQSVRWYDQMINRDDSNFPAADIMGGNFGAFECVGVEFCRTESAIFLWQNTGVSCFVAGITQQCGAPEWQASSGMPAKYCIKAGPSGNKAFFTTTAGGTTGAVEPTWANYTDGQTFTDGTVTWKCWRTNFIWSGGGSTVDYNTVNPEVGIVKVASGVQNTPDYRLVTAANSPYRCNWKNGTIGVDTTSGARTIWLDDEGMIGRTITIQKLTNSANAITLKSKKFITGSTWNGTEQEVTWGAGAEMTKTYTLSTLDGEGGSDGMWRERFY